MTSKTIPIQLTVNNHLSLLIIWMWIMLI